MKKYNHFTTDIFFTLALFCVFIASSLFIVIMGADIYEKTINSIENNFNLETSIAYLRQKTHQNDFKDKICESQVEGITALLLKDENDEFYTYIYYYNGYLQEQLVKKNSSPSLSGGEEISKLLNFNFEFISQNLIRFSLCDENNSTKSIYINLKSA